MEPFTGDVLWEKHLRRISVWGDFFVNDVLVSNAKSISMSAWMYDPKSGERSADSKEEQSRYLRSGTSRTVGLIPFGFLYDRKDGAERCVRYQSTYWSYRGTRGLLLAFTHDRVFGVAQGKNAWERSEWELFAKSPNDDPSASGIPSEKAEAEKEAPLWSVKVPAGTLALLPAGKTLFVAGPVDPADAKGGALRCYSADDGRKLSELRFDEAPVFDGMAASGGRLYISTQRGMLLCFGGR
jgi:uncharacterized membrane protein